MTFRKAIQGNRSHPTQRGIAGGPQRADRREGSFPSIAEEVPFEQPDTARNDPAAAPALEVRNLTHVFQRAGQPSLTAVDRVSFTIYPGECFGLVGESGSGKSTTANMILRLLDVTEGTVLLEGRDITQAKGRLCQNVYRYMQAVFQDPVQSFDPRRTIGQSVVEPLRNRRVPSAQALQQALDLMRRCGLPQEIVDRYPRQVSGGQCQRAAIARALIVRPHVLVCDEATSALDVTVQRHIVELLASLQRERGLALLFISHDLALVSHICNRIAVMQKGCIVEQGATDQIIAHPHHPYTRQLLQSANWMVGGTSPR